MIDDALLAAVLEDPDADAPRLVYADWLEERGDPRGEYLRIECQLLKLPAIEGRFSALWARLQELHKALDLGWVARVRRLPRMHVVCAEDGLGLVLVIANPASIPVTVFEPHPHTSVLLFDAHGQPWPMHYGPFAAGPRWQVTVPPGQTCRRIVTLPRFFLDARGVFEAECTIRYRVGEQAGKLTVHGPVRLALPTTDEYYSEAGLLARQRVERYGRSGYEYPLAGDTLPAEARGDDAADPG
jgi:uncharacterized protein (TIGR02996 family)